MPDPIRFDSASLDLSRRFKQTVAIAASPAAGAETTIATFTIADSLQIVSGIQLYGFAAFTVGTSGANANLKIRQTNTSGTTIAATGATTGGIAAGNLVDINVQGFDTAAVLPNQVYVLTLTIGSGAATSTVSAVSLSALII